MADEPVGTAWVRGHGGNLWDLRLTADSSIPIYCRRGSKPPSVPHCVPRPPLCPPSLSSSSYNST